MKGNQNHNSLNHLTECPLCGTKYNRSDIVVLREGKARAVFHLTCSKCGTAMLAFVSNTPQGIVNLGMATDLNAREALMSFEKKAVDSDNILNVYSNLKSKSRGRKINLN